MSSWDVNNIAHTNLWGFERWRLKNKTGSFKKDGESWGVDYLIGIVAGESDDMSRNKAEAHAVLLDEVFTDFYHASYEAGVTREAAISTMLAILKDSDKKLKDLGGPVSDAYRFRGEI